MPVHNWPVGVPWLASGMEPERRFRDSLEAKRAKMYRGCDCQDPDPLLEPTQDCDSA